MTDDAHPAENDEYGEPKTHVGRVEVQAMRLEYGEAYPLSNCRPMTILGFDREVVEIETTIRARIIPPAVSGAE